MYALEQPVKTLVDLPIRDVSSRMSKIRCNFTLVRCRPVPYSVKYSGTTRATTKTEKTRTLGDRGRSGEGGEQGEGMIVCIVKRRGQKKSFCRKCIREEGLSAAYTPQLLSKIWLQPFESMCLVCRYRETQGHRQESQKYRRQPRAYPGSVDETAKPP